METLLAALALGGLGFASSAYGASKNKQTGFAMNKESWKYYQLQKELDYKYDSGKYLDLDKDYNNWYKELEYNWKKQYAENSAKWNVEGLKNAGLNPILAASGGFTPSQMTSGPVSAQRHSSGSAIGNSADMKSDWDIAGNTASLMGTAKTAALLGSEIKEARAKAEVADKTVPTQIDTATKQRELLDAQTLKAKADAANATSAAAKSAQETSDMLKREGLTGEAANALVAMKRLKAAGEHVVNSLTNSAKTSADYSTEELEKVNKDSWDRYNAERSRFDKLPDDSKKEWYKEQRRKHGRDIIRGRGQTPDVPTDYLHNGPRW